MFLRSNEGWQMGRIKAFILAGILIRIFLLSSVQSPRNFGYIVAGFSNSYSHGQEDFLVFKLDMEGEVQWVKNVGGSGRDCGLYVRQTADSGYILTGYTQSTEIDNPGLDILAFKLNQHGKKQGRRSFGEDGDDSASCIIQTPDGGYVIGGWTENPNSGNGLADFLLLKLTAKGDLLWRRTLGGAGNDYGRAVCLAPDGGYVILGISDSFTNGEYDFLLYKIDSEGNKIWRKNFGGVESEWIEPGGPGGQTLAPMPEGGFIFCGSTGSFTNGGSDIAVYKIDESGTMISRFNVGGDWDDIGSSVCPTKDGGFVVAGSTQSFINGATGDDWDFLVYKFSPDSTIQWMKNFGGEYEDMGISVEQDPVGHFIVAGTSMSYVSGEPGVDRDMLIYNVDGNGNVCWKRNLGGVSAEYCAMAHVTGPYFPPVHDNVIDHRCARLSDIHPYWIDRAKTLLRCSYGHSSYGLQPVNGMLVLSSITEFDNLYQFNRDGLVVPGVLSIADCTPLGDLGEPDRRTWAQRTRNYLTEAGIDRNVVIWAWCGQVGYSSEGDIDLYLSLMSELENDFPGVAFIYMTGHLDGTGAAGNLNVRNNQIRSYCLQNKKYLYDFADIESFDPDGVVNYMELFANQACDYNGGNWAIQWCETHPNECSGCYCAHSQSLNCDLKARSFWWLMTRLAGWNGN